MPYTPPPPSPPSPPSPPPPPSGLRGLLETPAVEDTWYNGKEIKLDGFKFKNCRFDNCRLIISSSNFSLDHCYIDDKSLIMFSGDIMKIIRIYNRDNQFLKDKVPSYVPTQNDDGTISIV